MSKEENKESAEDTSERAFKQYQSLGGIINETDYQSALDKARSVAKLSTALILQAEIIAEREGITLHNSKDAIDPRTALYGILRTGTKSYGVKYHHSQMSDQRLFAEALRMLGDSNSLQKLVETNPHISFK